MFIAIHALVMTTLVRVARSTSERRKSQSSVLLMAVSAAADDANLVYFAFVNYTTLGYGDSKDTFAKCAIHWSCLRPFLSS